MGGSEYIEALTDAIERGVHEYLERIDEMGGTLRAIETGYIQNEIQNAAYEYQRGIESGAARRGGREPVPEGGRARRAHLPARSGARTVRRSNACARCAPAAARARSRRNWQRSNRRRADGDNLMPPILEAAAVYATVGEISDRLRGVFGEYREA